MSQQPELLPLWALLALRYFALLRFGRPRGSYSSLSLETLGGREALVDVAADPAVRGLKSCKDRGAIR